MTNLSALEIIGSRGVPRNLKEGPQFKKGLHVLRCPVSTKNIGENHFLRGPRLQPALCLLVNPVLHAS